MELVTQQYVLSSLVTQYIVTEKEMADAMGCTVEQLLLAIEKDGIGYHAHPTATKNGEYQFLPRQLASNVAIWQCVNGDGHDWRIDHYTGRSKPVYKCQKCHSYRYS